MRWDELFRDLEAQMEAAGAADLAAEVGDRVRRESATLSLRDRACGGVGQTVSVLVPGAGAVAGVLCEVGAEWLLVAEDGGRQTVVPLGSVLSIGGLSGRTEEPGSGGRVFDRLGLASALRGIARDRIVVSVVLVDGSTLTGRVDRVGSDFLELSASDGDGVGAGARGSVRSVPFAAMAVVRSTE